jgi:type II secretory pathway pseudopilin PulG
VVAVRRVSCQRGFTYLGLVILLTIIGLVGAAALKVDALLRRAQAEQELLEVGAAFGEALRSYAQATPPGQPTQPPDLQALLRDPRAPGVRRHLRKVFVDPVTGKAEWGIVYAGDRKGVLAVYSLSSAAPLKIANFDSRFQGFENKQHLSDWKFTASGQGTLARATVSVTADDRRAPPDSDPPLVPPRPNAEPAPPPEPVPPAAEPAPADEAAKAPPPPPPPEEAASVPPPPPPEDANSR